jgi:hypothetical protein
MPVAALPWLAGALIIGELVSGVWLAVRPRSRALEPVWVYTAVTLAWATLGLQAQLRGLSVDNCGCFGMYLTQRLSWFVLAQDALLLYAVLMIRGGRRGRPAATSDSATIKEKGMTVRAVFHGQVIAESDDTVLVEGNHYFPADSVRREFLTDSTTHTGAHGRAAPATTRSPSTGSPRTTPPGTTRIRRRSPARSRTGWRSGVAFRSTSSPPDSREAHSRRHEPAGRRGGVRDGPPVAPFGGLVRWQPRRYSGGARFYDVLSLERPVYRPGRVAGIAALRLRPGSGFWMWAVAPGSICRCCVRVSVRPGPLSGRRQHRDAAPGGHSHPSRRTACRRGAPHPVTCRCLRGHRSAPV